MDYLDYDRVSGLNLYAYRNNNPVMYSDGDGHFGILTAMLIGAVVGYVVGVGIDFLLELEINGKSIIDYVRDGIYDFWKNLFD